MLQQMFSRILKKKPPLITDVHSAIPAGVTVEPYFPRGYNVYSFAPGPSGVKQLIVSAGDPASSKGCLFIGDGGTGWRQIDLPDETAFLSRFVRLKKDGHWIAAGMTAIGRGAILLGNPAATEWTSASIDLHSYSSIHDLIQLSDGSLLAASGQMITQGKTRPVLFRSVDGGLTWSREECSLPISTFLSFAIAPDGTIYGGTAGDVDPVLYRSTDQGRSWETLPKFPGYKTYKMISVRWVQNDEGPKLFVVLWGYKTDIADRVVRFYVATPDSDQWDELPPIDDSHFIFSFEVLRNGSFLIGSEKGRIYHSGNHGRTWNILSQFQTNIGAYAIYEDSLGRVWIGKDFVPPDHFSLWCLAK